MNEHATAPSRRSAWKRLRGRLMRTTERSGSESGARDRAVLEMERVLRVAGRKGRLDAGDGERSDPAEGKEESARNGPARGGPRPCSTGSSGAFTDWFCSGSAPRTFTERRLPPAGAIRV